MVSLKRRCNHFRLRLVAVALAIIVGCVMYGKEILIAKQVHHLFDNPLYEEPCIIPVLDPYHPSIRKLIWKPEPIVCSHVPSIVYVDEYNVLHVNRSAFPFFEIRSEADIICSAEPIYRSVDDFHVVYGNRYTLKFPAQLQSDFNYIQCKNGNRVLFDKIVAGISAERITTKPDIGHETDEQLSVVLLGVDSVSRSASIRGIPKTIDYLKSIGSYDFRGYMKVGDNTTPNLFGLLTGLQLFTDETPNAHGLMDKWPHLWKNFSAQNYVTMFAEDMQDMAMMNMHEFRGFETQPTDHYSRPLWLATDQQKTAFKRMSTLIYRELVDKTHSTLCEKNTKKSLEVLNYLKLFTKRYKERLKFSFTFLTEVAHHDTNYLVHSDDEFRDFFRWLKDAGVLKRSIVFFFSDHGSRHNTLRNTVAGRMESRMPMLYVLLPEHIKTKYPDVDANLKVNTQRLVSVYDIHQTLVDVLNQNYANPSTQIVRGTKRGISLFKEISGKRSCKEAAIPSSFCACYMSQAINITTNKVLHNVAERLVDYINTIVASEPKCKKLRLHKIISADKVSATLKHMDTLHNGYTLYRFFKPEESKDSYNIVIETQPGLAQFDVACEFDSKGNVYSVGNVDRTNLYGNQSHCVNKARLKQYCYC